MPLKVSWGQQIFPQKFFPNYLVHFHSTETAVLYHKGLCVTPLSPQDNYLKTNHRDNFHICGIILHSQTSDYGIYSVYRPQKADPNQIFQYQFETDRKYWGDFNIHHPLWGSDRNSKQSSDFLNCPTQSNQNFKPTNSTRLDPRNSTLTCIDIT